jgi:phosphoglycolate phosphatase-like HAD superfamily hydrolase
MFDFDGTLADTLPLCAAAFQAATAEVGGVHLSVPQITAMFGPNEVGILRQVLGGRWEDGLSVFLREYDRRHPEICTGPFPGVREMLADLRGHGVKLGMITGKGPLSAAISFRHVGMEDAFDFVKAGKPEGCVKQRHITEALAEHGIAAARAAYVGDTPGDIAASRAVGVLAVAAAWAGTADLAALMRAEPDHLFTSVADLREWAVGQVAG